MAAILYLAPEFLKENRLYWLRSPLYIVTDKSGKEEYYFTDEELEAAKSKIKGTIARNKGLGEASPFSLHQSMFTPQYQRLELLEYTEESEALLRQLMGEDVTYRKDFIFNNVDFSTIKE